LKIYCCFCFVIIFVYCLFHLFRYSRIIFYNIYFLHCLTSLNVQRIPSVKNTLKTSRINCMFFINCAKSLFTIIMVKRLKFTYSFLVLLFFSCVSEPGLQLCHRPLKPGLTILILFHIKEELYSMYRPSAAATESNQGPVNYIIL